MSFGWSAGDIIAGITVLIQVFKALDDTRGGKAVYSELIRELTSLQSALDNITRLGDNDSLKEATENCQKCIDAFVERIKKFRNLDKDHGQSRWSIETFKKNVRAVEWAMCKKDEIESFRKAVLFHTMAILSLQISVLSSGMHSLSTNHLEALASVEREVRHIASALEQIGKDSAANHEQENSVSTSIHLGVSGVLDSLSEMRPMLADIQNQMSEMRERQSKSLNEQLERRPIFPSVKPDVAESNSLTMDLLIKWLEPSEDYSATHLSIRDRRIHAAAGQWVFEDKKFKAWRDHPGKQLWLHGKVGSGKTIICSSIIESLRKELSDSSSISKGFVLYYYFAFYKSADQDLGAFFRTMIYQFCTSEGIPPQVERIFTVCKRSALGRPKVPIPGSLELESLFLEICRNPSSHGFLLLDGMDEIPHGQQREDFLRLLRMLTGSERMEGPAAPSLRLQSTLSILVTSQSQPDFDNEFLWDRGWESLGLGRSRVDIDIERFVHYELSNASKFAQLSADHRQEILDYLVANADGVFQWVDLILQMLKIPRILRPSQIKEILKALPTGLEGTYERLLERVDEDESPEVSRALKWLSLARRPLYIEEVIEASILDIDNDVIHDADRRMTPAQIRSCLTGLVTIEPPLGPGQTARAKMHIMSLAHSSVRDYLLMKRPNHSPRNVFHFGKFATDEFIARCCVEYWSRCAFTSWRHYPLAAYSNRFWRQHAGHNQGLLENLGSKVNKIRAPVLSPVIDSRGKLMQSSAAHSMGDFIHDTYDSLIQTSASTNDGSALSTDISYLYTPLQSDGSFRLLVILPSHHMDDLLECTIQNVLFEDRPHYAALSYTWGDPENKAILILNGNSHEVTPNLEAALRHLRAQSGGAPFTCWVDQICIDQSNFAERNHQVNIMTQIFSRAHKTIVWLGENTDSSVHAMNYLAKFQEIPPLPESARNLLIAMGEDTWCAMQGLLQRKWFSRLWVVQEMAIAREVEVLCGTESFPWSVLELIEAAYVNHGFDVHSETRRFLQYPQPRKSEHELTSRWENTAAQLHVKLQGSGGSLSSEEHSQYVLASGLLTMMLAMRRQYQEGRQFNFLSFLIATRYYKCVDSRDRIYSSMSFLTSNEHSGAAIPPSVDYSLSITEACLKWSRYWLLESQNLDLLSCINPSVCQELPSWALDVEVLTQPLDAGKWLHPFDTKVPRLYNATSFSTPILVFIDSGLTLVLSGIEAGRITTVGYPNFETISGMGHNAFCRTMLADQERPPFEYARRLGSLDFDEDDTNSILAIATCLPDSTPTEGTVTQDTRNREFFISSAGTPGLGPRQAREGDLIVLFRGARVPFIIRQVMQIALPESPKHYRLIGEAYVHGIMDGEAWKEVDGKVEGERNFYLI